MSNYSDKLRRERQEELVARVETVLSEGEEIELGIVSFFKEKLHPRSKDGRFTSGSNSSKSMGSSDYDDMQKLAKSSEIKNLDNDIKKTLAEAKRLDNEASALEKSMIAAYKRIEDEAGEDWEHPNDAHKTQLKKLAKQIDDVKKLRAKADDARGKELTLGQKRYKAAYKILKVGDDPFKKDRAGQLLRDLGKPKPALKPAPKPSASSQRKPSMI